MSKYCIKRMYFARRKRVFFDDRLNNKEIIYQKEVYDSASNLASDCQNIIDFGCGNGQKLFQLSLLHRDKDRIIGIDYDQNIHYCMNAYKSNISWLENDFDSEDPIELDMKGKSLFLCADVIEHVLYPEKLLYKIKSNMKKDDVLCISTPERDLVRGKFHFGPPTNFNHIREWNEKEFAKYLKSYGFIINESKLVYDDNINKIKNCQMHIVSI